MVIQQKIYTQQVAEEHKMRPQLFTYPNFEASSSRPDYGDLAEHAMLILCVRKAEDDPESKHIAYIWQGEDFDPSNFSPDASPFIARSVEEFKHRVLQKYWGNDYEQRGIDVEIVYEESADESDEFTKHFD